MTFLKTIYAASAAITVSLGSACTANSAEVQVAQATNYLKPGASVTYSHNLKSQLSAGESTIFNLSLSESYPNGTLKVSLRSEGDIDLFASSTQAEFDMSFGTSHDMNISFTARGDGRYYINVQALAVSPSGLSQPRIFSIPLQVGPPVAQKPDENMKTLESGENIIEMEAQEVIK